MFTGQAVLENTAINLETKRFFKAGFDCLEDKQNLHDLLYARLRLASGEENRSGLLVCAHDQDRLSGNVREEHCLLTHCC